MGLESASYISELVDTNPTGADDKNQGDNHLRLIKEVLQTQFPNLGAAAMTATSAQLNDLIDNNRGMPTGTVVMWTGTSGDIPTGWLLCDGTNSTPNLTSKFVYGGTSSGATGGAATHTHTANQAAHTHLVSRNGWGTTGVAPSPTTSIGSGYLVVGSGNNETGETLESLRAAGSAKTSEATDPAITVAAGSSLPPYYTLVYIMKD